MIFTILTLFPSIFESPLNESLIKKARDKGPSRLQYRLYQGFRDATSTGPAMTPLSGAVQAW